jgi:hypothetical protein
MLGIRCRGEETPTAPKGSFVRRSVAFCEPDAESRERTLGPSISISMRMRAQRGRVVESGFAAC